MLHLKVDTLKVDKMLDEFIDMPKDVMKEAFKFYKNETPVRSGNARNNTKLRSKQIKSGYAYAGRLDEGWSTQAPNGMTEPTIDKIEDLIDRKITTLSR